jgi:hypothetical protein
VPSLGRSTWLALGALVVCAACGARSALLQPEPVEEGGGGQAPGGGGSGEGGEGGAAPAPCLPGAQPHRVVEDAACYASFSVDEASITYTRAAPSEGIVRRSKSGGPPSLVVPERIAVRLIDAGARIYAAGSPIVCRDACFDVVVFDETSGAPAAMAAGLEEPTAFVLREGDLFVQHGSVVGRLFLDGGGFISVAARGTAAPAQIDVRGGRLFYFDVDAVGQRALVRADASGATLPVTLVANDVPNGSIATDEAWIYFGTTFGNLARVGFEGGGFGTLAEGFVYHLLDDGDVLYASTLGLGQVVRIDKANGERTPIYAGTDLVSHIAVDDTCVYWMEIEGDPGSPSCRAAIVRAPK